MKERRLDDALVAARLERAVALRERLFEGADTDGGRCGGLRMHACVRARVRAYVQSCVCTWHVCKRARL